MPPFFYFFFTFFYFFLLGNGTLSCLSFLPAFPLLRLLKALP